MAIRSILEIPGILAAHATDEEAATGCTVILCPKGATGGVDVRGGAPATRETDLLRPEETVDVLHAVVLSGGSAYGLAASCGVANELERHGIGVDVGVGVVPIVSSACLFDLGCGSATVRPDVAMGERAARKALASSGRDGMGSFATGNVGAGTGCTVGKMAGPSRSMKAGLGQAVNELGPLVCGAVSAVNAAGNIYDPATGEAIAGTLDVSGTRIMDPQEALGDLVSQRPWLRTNTTISCVVTNARLSKAQATKVAQMAADAYAHAIKPTHTTNDGDTIFVMATGEVEMPVDVVGMVATEALEQAIAEGARSARGAYGFRAHRDL